TTTSSATRNLILCSSWDSPYRPPTRTSLSTRIGTIVPRGIVAELAPSPSAKAVPTWTHTELPIRQTTKNHRKHFIESCLSTSGFKWQYPSARLSSCAFVATRYEGVGSPGYFRSP